MKARTREGVREQEWLTPDVVAVAAERQFLSGLVPEVQMRKQNKTKGLGVDAPWGVGSVSGKLASFLNVRPHWDLEQKRTWHHRRSYTHT